jgi:hypothetical protein
MEIRKNNCLYLAAVVSLKCFSRELAISESDDGILLLNSASFYNNFVQWTLAFSSQEHVIAFFW